MKPTPNSVLVGVTDAGENTDALQYALEEAKRSGHGITLVHAVTAVVPPPPLGVLPGDDWLELGQGIISRARHELEQLGSPPSVTTVVRVGHPAGIFSELSKGASTVVLQHQDLSRVHRIFTGSTVSSVAAHTHAPVVAVPAGASGRTPTGTISVGVRGDGGPPEVLEAAFAEASARGSRLRVVHAWNLPAAYDDLRAQWSAEDDTQIAAAMADLQAKFPDVEVRVDVHNEWPAEVLVEAAKSSDLLVVGRHSGLPMLPARLGSLARAAVTHAACPVMIVPV